jgi:ABC-2 type transport system ATP-binding protein
MHLTIQNLSKQYRRGFFGLCEFDLEVKPGVIGLLGPNGARRSTLIRMLATITQPSAGTIQWDCVDIVKSPDALRAALGYLPQDFGVYPNLSASPGRMMSSGWKIP